MNALELLRDAEQAIPAIEAVRERALAFLLVGRAWMRLGQRETAARSLQESTRLYKESDQQRNGQIRTTLDAVEFAAHKALVAVGRPVGAPYHFDWQSELQRIIHGFPIDDEPTWLPILGSRDNPRQTEAHYKRQLQKASTVHPRLHWTIAAAQDQHFALARRAAQRLTDPTLRALVEHRIAREEWSPKVCYMLQPKTGLVVGQVTAPSAKTAALFCRTLPILLHCPARYDWALDACGLARPAASDDTALLLLERVGERKAILALLHQGLATDRLDEGAPRRLYPSLLWFRRLGIPQEQRTFLRRWEAAFLKHPPKAPHSEFHDYEVWSYVELFLREQAWAGDRAGALAFLAQLVSLTNEENALLWCGFSASFAQLGALPQGQALLEKALQQPLRGASQALLRAAGLANLAYCTMDPRN